MKLLTSTVKDESKSCMPERCFCEGPIKCINWTSTTVFQLNQNVSSWSPWREWLSDSQQVDVSGKIGFLSNSTFDVRHHYWSKSSEFRQTSHCLTAHGKIINSVQPLNNLIISTSPISLTLASSQWNVYLTFECFETSRPIYSSSLHFTVLFWMQTSRDYTYCIYFVQIFWFRHTLASLEECCNFRLT